MPYYTDSQRAEIAKIEEKIASAKTEALRQPGAKQRLAAWVAQRRAESKAEPDWTVVTPEL